MMKRPQSAKPGHKGYWGNSSVEDMNEQQQKPVKKQPRIIKPDFNHEYARILPRKIQQDKERLYSQALQLKQNMNEVAEQNLKLKTKISILEREKEKMNRMMETAPEGLASKGSRLNVYQTRTYEVLIAQTQKDNMIVRNLKKLVKECREENEELKAENQKIKKVMKYTKINEIEVERKTVIDHNKKLSAMLEEYSSQFANQQDIEKENQQLKKILEEEIEERNQLEQEREKYEEIIESLEDKIKSQAEKHQNKQKKLARDLNAQKRKVNGLQRKNQQLARELKSLRQNQQFIEQHQKNSKSAVRVSNLQRNSKQGRFNTQQSDSGEVEKKMNELRSHNEQLGKQLQEVKKKLRALQEEKAVLQSSHHKKPQLSNKEQREEEGVEHQKSKEEEEEEEEEEEYEQEFTEEQQNTKQESKEQNELQKYKKDFQENEEQQEIFKQEQPKKDKPLKEKKQKKGAYKPNKKVLAEIKELLTYRMKSQRYPFTDIKSDIEAAEAGTFTYIDLCNMFVNQPFYLTAQYTKTFLAYCFERQTNEGSDTISNAVLISKLRKVIDDFQLMEENEEKEMIIRIAEMTSTYPRQLQVAFQNIKNGEETVARKDLIDMFKKLQLEDKYIELIIAQLSLCSDDLEHLNFHGFFERFYIEDEEQDYMDNAIEEQGEESEESHKHSSRVKKQAKGNKSDAQL